MLDQQERKRIQVGSRNGVEIEMTTDDGEREKGNGEQKAK
jgi:hypothetical protein